MKNLNRYGLFKQFFKGCLPQILLGPFSNTLFHLFFLTSSFLTPDFSFFKISFLALLQKKHSNHRVAEHAQFFSAFFRLFYQTPTILRVVIYLFDDYVTLNFYILPLGCQYILCALTYIA